LTVSILFNEFYLIISTNKGCLLCKPVRGELRIQGEVFATELIPTAISFISSDRFVIAEKRQATIFQIVDGRPRQVGRVETHTPIIGVMPTSERTQFALLEQSGRVTMCEAE
jgi:hypothetical protein